MKRIRIMWAKEKLNTLKDVYCRVRLAGKSGKLMDGTTWSLTVPTPEDFGFNCKEPHRYLQLNFSNPVARSTILMARYAPRTLAHIEDDYLRGIALSNDTLRRYGLELAQPDDADAFYVRFTRKK